MGKITSSSTSDVLLDWQAMANMFEEQACWLVALNDWQIALILSLLRYAHWVTRWINFNNWDDVDASVAETERCLMSGCDLTNLTETLNEIKEAILTIAIPSGGGGGGVTIVNCATQGTGESPPSSSGEEGEDPPTGWLDPGVIDDRKCKVANWIYDNVREVIYQFSVNNVDVIAEFGVGLAVGLVIALLALVVSGPLAVLLVVVGLASSLTMRLLVGDIDLDGLLDLVDGNKQDLVCALYNETTAAGAREAFKATLANKGAATAQVLLIDVLLVNDVTNSLFFQRDDEFGQRLEAELDEYVGSVDCGYCVGVGYCVEAFDEDEWEFDFIGPEGSGYWYDGKLRCEMSSGGSLCTWQWLPDPGLYVPPSGVLKVDYTLTPSGIAYKNVYLQLFYGSGQTMWVRANGSQGTLTLVNALSIGVTAYAVWVYLECAGGTGAGTEVATFDNFTYPC
jgi:hypothetical protein